MKFITLFMKILNFLHFQLTKLILPERSVKLVSSVATPSVDIYYVIICMNMI